MNFTAEPQAAGNNLKIPKTGKKFKNKFVISEQVYKMVSNLLARIKNTTICKGNRRKFHNRFMSKVSI